MKICNDCEAIFSDHYTECPSCEGESMKRYLPSVKQVEEIEEVQNFEFIEPFVVDGDIDDFGSM